MHFGCKAGIFLLDVSTYLQVNLSSVQAEVKKHKESFSHTLWWSPRDRLSLWVILYLLSSQVLISPLALAMLSPAM